MDEKSKSSDSPILNKEVEHHISPPASLQSELEQVVDNILHHDNKDKQEIINNLYQILISFQSESYPFPHPDMLERYKRLDPDVFQKLISITEKTIEHDLDLERRKHMLEEKKHDDVVKRDDKRLNADIEIAHKQLDNDIAIRNKAQIFAFSITLLSFLGGVFAMIKGLEIGGSFLAFFGLASSIVTIFLKNSNRPSPK